MNIIGGLTLDEPAADLAAVVAIASSYLDKPVPGTMAAVGEVGLSGEIRSITHMEQRLSEVRRLGFTQCMVPAHKVKDLKAPAGLELLPEHRCIVTLRQGKFHQVKRMLASRGAPVVTLHRLSMGALTLPETLLPGQWRPLTESEVNTLRRECGL